VDNEQVQSLSRVQKVSRAETKFSQSTQKAKGVDAGSELKVTSTLIHKVKDQGQSRRVIIFGTLCDVSVAMHAYSLSRLDNVLVCSAWHPWRLKRDH
jgi:hypothetical protein